MLRLICVTWKMWDSMEWIKAMVGSRKKRRRRKRLAFKDILSTSRRAAR